MGIVGVRHGQLWNRFENSHKVHKTRWLRIFVKMAEMCENQYPPMTDKIHKLDLSMPLWFSSFQFWYSLMFEISFRILIGPVFKYLWRFHLRLNNSELVRHICVHPLHMCTKSLKLVLFGQWTIWNWDWSDVWMYYEGTIQ